MCVGSSVGLFFVALSSQKLNTLQLKEEGLDLERQVGLQSLQQSMQEEWSLLNDNREEARPREMQRLGRGIEMVNDQRPKLSAANRRRPARSESQEPDSSLLQGDDEASSSRQEQMAKRAAALGVQNGVGHAEGDARMQEANGARRRLVVSESQYLENVLLEPYKLISKQNPLATRQDGQPQEELPMSFEAERVAGEFKQDIGYTASAYEAQSYAEREKNPRFSLTSRVAPWYQVVERLDEQQERRIAALQRTHEERMSSLEHRIETERHKSQEAAAWQLTWLLACMLVVGCFSAVPDSVLGASAAHDLSELPGAVRSNVAAVAAFINAIGALGALCQVSQSCFAPQHQQCRFPFNSQSLNGLEFSKA